MNKNKKAFKELNALAKADPGNWKKEVYERKEKKAWLRTSQKIAFKILRALRAQKKTQKELASIMDVSPQQVNKWVKGKENFTLDTLCRLEEALNIKFISTNVEEITEKEGMFFYSPSIQGDWEKSRESRVFNIVKAHLESKNHSIRGTRRFPKTQNYKFTSVDVEKKKEGFNLDPLIAGSEITSYWNSFNNLFEDDDLIELKPKNEYNQNLDLNQSMVAETESDKY
jgi:transcriptional regulator with XRE-family HTH domain